ncbi:MAG: type II secretion system protein GspF [Myxococcales bacterium]|nr:type II secretion system protein GspF [Myxococcales bacterium]
MPSFDFKGLDKAGKDISGVRDADNEKSLRTMLKRDGIFLTSIGKGSKKGGGVLATEVDVAAYFERISPSDLAIFTRQLATLTKAGIPLVECIGAVADQVEKPKLRKIIGELKQDVIEGSSLAAAIGKHPEVFSPIFTNMIRAGEASGTLDRVLTQLAEFTEASVKLRNKVFSAMMYPALMVGAGGLLLVGMFVYVIPQITQIFEDTGQELPFLTRLLIGISHAMRDYWWVCMLCAGLSIWGFRKWKRSKKGAVAWDQRKLGFPIIGKLILMIAIARFTKTLATLLRSGVPLLTALEITKNVMENLVLDRVVDEARVAVKEGASLAEPLKRSGRFPPIVTHMVAIGERSGALEEMLTVVSEAYESQVDNRISTMTSLLEPIMIMCMGITIAIIVFAVLMPILQLNDFVQ